MELSPDMKLVPEEGPHNNNENSSIESVLSFERSLEKECKKYGYDRGLRKASQLYKDNLNLEDKLIEKEIEIKEYKNKIEHLRMLLESKTPKYIRNCGIDEISTPDILTPDVITPEI